jgi:hypothetical protein
LPFTSGETSWVEITTFLILLSIIREVQGGVFPKILQGSRETYKVAFFTLCRFSFFTEERPEGPQIFFKRSVNQKTCPSHPWLTSRAHVNF